MTPHNPITSFGFRVKLAPGEANPRFFYTVTFGRAGTGTRETPIENYTAHEALQIAMLLLTVVAHGEPDHQKIIEATWNHHARSQEFVFQMDKALLALNLCLKASLDKLEN